MGIRGLVFGVGLWVGAASLATAQQIAAPPGWQISSTFAFKNDQLLALFGSPEIKILCLSRGEAMPIVVVTNREALALNGNARDSLKGAPIYVDGAKLEIADPYLAKDQRSEFLGRLVGRAAQACRGN